MDIRKNDIVEVIAGDDRGRGGQHTRGRVLEVDPSKNRLYVEHVNMVKRHVRPNPAKQIRGGILEKEGPIQVSNVALVCSDCGPTRIQHRAMADGKKARVCAKCEKSLDK